MASLTPGFVEALLLTVLVSGASACVRTSLQDTPNGRADARSVGALAFRAEDDQLLLLNEPGTLYLLDFVAVGCKPCVEEAPDMERLDREFGASGRFRLVTVVFGWPSNQLADRREELNLEHLTLYADEGGSAARALEVQGWPTKCLIRDGRVLLHRVGGGPGAYSIWRKIIREHLKRRSTAELQASPPNNGVNATVRPVTPLAVASVAPGGSARYALR